MNGKTFQAAETQIILKTSAGPVERFAAEELRRALREISGSAPPIQTEGKPGGFSIELETLAKENPEIRFDGFRIAVSGTNLRITANLPRGILNGVYELLDFWGCRWFFYRESPLYPQASELPLPENGISNPDLELRGVCIFPVNAEHCEELRRILDWLGRNRFNLLLTSINRTKKRDNGWEVEWRQVERELLPELTRRSMILNISEHSGRYFFPVSLFEEHPEWFAMNAEGRRFSTGQICYSNEEAVKVLVRNFTEYAEKHPEVSILGTWPEDGYGFCKCENCSRPGTVLKAVNRIADAIRKVRPDLTVEYLSYTSETSDVPPDILPRDNMSILIANMRVASEWKAKIDKDGIWLEQLETDPAKYIPAEYKSVNTADGAVAIDLNRPMKEILAELTKYPVKTRLKLSGTIIVGRDIAHAKLKERLDKGEGLPQYIKDHPIYYAGPAKTPEGMPSGSFGPTTAGRMDPYVDLFQSNGGSMIMIAKGNRSQVVTDSCKKHGGFYLGSIGGPAALLAKENIKKVELLEYPELGMEAIWKIDVVDFPAFILVDDKGNDFFKML